MPALDALEKFIHYSRADTPTLIHCALAHAQFETIHPFLDGNGRVGRLLITLMLVEAKVLSRPLLYLSLYLKSNRSEYYERLTNIRFRGEWEAWVKFFLKGIAQTAKAATNTGREIVTLRENHRTALAHSPNAQTLIDHLFAQPYITVQIAQNILQCSTPTAGKVVYSLKWRGILQEVTGRQRNRVYRYAPLIELFERAR
jgi:Fic family protein